MAYVSSAGILAAAMLTSCVFAYRLSADPDASEDAYNDAGMKSLCNVEVWRVVKGERFGTSDPPEPEVDDSIEMIIQPGKFGANVIRVVKGISAESFQCIMDSIIRNVTQKVEHGREAAIYLGLRHESMNGGVMSVVKKLGFRFHHHLSDETDPYTWHDDFEFMFYKWICVKEGCRTGGKSDLVPTYTTSIEGGGVMVLSPDRKEVLLVNQWGGVWSAPGGAVSPKETTYEAASREVEEELDIKLDKATLALVAVGNIGAKYDRVNDHYMLYAAQAKDKNFKPDGIEVTVANARWFSLQDLGEVYDSVMSGPDHHRQSTTDNQYIDKIKVRWVAPTQPENINMTKYAVENKPIDYVTFDLVMLIAVKNILGGHEWRGVWSEARNEGLYGVSAVPPV